MEAEDVALELAKHEAVCAERGKLHLTVLTA